MKHRRMHGLEKVQVQLAAAAALAAVYFWLGRALLPPDPLEAIVMLPFGDWARAGRLVLLLLGLGAFCAAVTISSRREGAMLAVLIGATGLSFLSPPIRSVLWVEGGDMDRLYIALIAEVVVLWCGLALCVVLIDLVRALLGRAFPQWAWKSPMADFSEEDARRVAADADHASNVTLVRHGIIRAVFVYLGYKGTGRVPAKGEKPASSLQGLYGAAMGLALSVVLLHIMLKTSDRGQILSSLATSFTVGTLIANQVFPTRQSLFAWAPPALAAIFFYAIAAVAGPHTPPTQSWTAIAPAASPLPIDWLSAGAGGSVLGFWISCRLHELRLLEKREKAGGEEE